MLPTPTGKSLDLGNGGVARENVSKANCQLEAGLEEAKVLFLLSVLVWRDGVTLVFLLRELFKICFTSFR